MDDIFATRPASTQSDNNAYPEQVGPNLSGGSGCSAVACIQVIVGFFRRRKFYLISRHFRVTCAIPQPAALGLRVSLQHSTAQYRAGQAAISVFAALTRLCPVLTTVFVSGELCHAEANNCRVSNKPCVYYAHVSHNPRQSPPPPVDSYRELPCRK